jgi:hypothetical protein
VVGRDPDSGAPRLHGGPPQTATATATGSRVDLARPRERVCASARAEHEAQRGHYGADCRSLCVGAGAAVEPREEAPVSAAEGTPARPAGASERDRAAPASSRRPRFRTATTRRPWRTVSYALLDLLLLLVLRTAWDALSQVPSTRDAPNLAQGATRAPLVLSSAPRLEPVPWSTPSPSALAASPPSAATSAAPSAAARPLHRAPRAGISGREPGASDVHDPWGPHE